MILAAAVCPHPPMLVPEIAVGAAEDLASLRTACDEAVSSLLALDPERVVVLGSGQLAGEGDEGAGGTFAPYGVDSRAGGSDDELPLSLTIGAWLLDRAGWAGLRTYSTSATSVEDRVVLLVMADGSAKRTTAAPGFLDERAEAFDARIARALAGGDASTLASLDADLGDELWAAGTRPLVTLGEMSLAQTAAGQTSKGATIAARLRCDVAPFGVGYWVADWVFS